MLADCFCSSLSRGAYVLTFFDSRVLVVFFRFQGNFLGGVIDYWLLIIDYWLLITDDWLLMADYWLLMTDCWWLIIDYSQAHQATQVSDYWLLITDGWLLIIRKLIKLRKFLITCPHPCGWTCVLSWLLQNLLSFARPFLAMAMIKRTYHCSSG